MKSHDYNEHALNYEKYYGSAPILSARFAVGIFTEFLGNNFYLLTSLTFVFFHISIFDDIISSLNHDVLHCYFYVCQMSMIFTRIHESVYIEMLV